MLLPYLGTNGVESDYQRPVPKYNALGIVLHKEGAKLAEFEFLERFESDLGNRHLFEMNKEELAEDLGIFSVTQSSIITTSYLMETPA